MFMVSVFWFFRSVKPTNFQKLFVHNVWLKWKQSLNFVRHALMPNQCSKAAWIHPNYETVERFVFELLVFVYIILFSFSCFCVCFRFVCAYFFSSGDLYQKKKAIGRQATTILIYLRFISRMCHRRRHQHRRHCWKPSQMPALQSPLAIQRSQKLQYKIPKPRPISLAVSFKQLAFRLVSWFHF